MAGFLSKFKSAGTSSGITAAKDGPNKKKDEPAEELTPLEKMLQNAGPLRHDGSDRFYGFENFGNTCYCNSIVQALFYNDLFRDHVINYPPHSPTDTPNGTRPTVNVTIRPPQNPTVQNGKKGGLSTSQTLKQRQAINSGIHPGLPGANLRPEEKPGTPEYKKKHAVLKGPVLELRQENALAYGMGECTFTGLKDIFLALIESQNRTGVLSPQRFLEIFKRDNELFRTSMHQDAHEFYGLVLNDVITNVENNARKQLEAQGPPTQDLNGLSESVGNALGSGLQSQHMNGTQSPGTGWVHDIFEGLLTSETQCLTCGTSSQRDETFLDLSIDLEEHSSVTSCLRKFSDDEVLCERNKFHCDSCGGLQEAEKRMMVKRLPKVLTLHLKRFKYTEDYSTLQKLFHRVVYPYHLRMFNTTEDAEHQDRLYELYAVVVHIGSNAFHGHYVSIIKTKDRGWVLFDDELVEPVDKHFVRNFFGGEKPGMATAYVLFYQETTFEKVREEQVAEGLEEVRLANRAANVATEDGDKGDKHGTNELRRQATQPARPVPEPDTTTPLARARTTPAIRPSPAAPTQSNDDPIASTAVQTPGNVPGTIAETPEPIPVVKSEIKSKEDKKREKKEREAVEKEKKAQAKQEDKRRKEERMKEIQARQKDHESFQKVIEESKKSAAREENARKKENGESSSYGMLSLSKNGGKSMNKRSFSFFNREKGDRDSASGEANGGPAETKEGFASRLSSSLLKKKSSNILTST